MLRYLRWIGVALCVHLMLPLFSQEEFQLLPAIALGLIVIALLYPELARLRIQPVWQGLCSFAKLLGNRMEKVERERYCGITTEKGGCAGDGVFLIVATVDDMTKPIDLRAGRGILCCKKHHPWPDKHGRGELADETLAMLRKSNLAIERLNMLYRPY